MSAVLRVVQAGPGVTLQDAGRWGYLRYGVTQAGPMDSLAHEFANRMVGNEAGAPALEISIGGLDVMVEEGALELCIVAPGFRVSRDGGALPPSCLVTLAPGEKLSVRAGESGAWAYLAPAGAVDAEPELGSLSMHVRTGVGGAGIKPGDRLHISAPRAGAAEARALAAFRAPSDAPILIVAGPQDDYFDAANFSCFLEGPWRVAARSDRMAYALEGPRLEHAKGFNIVSDGIALGAIQVPGDGWPFVQMADRAPTGGYPKIGTVIAADLGRLAQMRPGARLSFQAVAVDEAVAAWRQARAFMETAGLAPQGAGQLTSEALLSRNLVGGVVSAHGAPE